MDGGEEAICDERFWLARGRDAADLLAAIQQGPAQLRQSIHKTVGDISPQLGPSGGPSDAKPDWQSQAALLLAAAPWLVQHAQQQDDSLASDALGPKHAWEQLVSLRQQMNPSPSTHAPPSEIGRRDDDIAIGWQWLLQGFNQAQRRQHGAYFTPPPLAEFMVRCTIQRMAQHFGCPCRIVDPAAGTGVFLQAFLDKCRDPKDHASVLSGWEVMPATAIIGDYLLRQRSDCAAKPSIIQQGSALHERNVPSDLPLVIIGNPPYSNYRSVNANQPDTSWLIELLADYKRGLTERKHNLHDDFIRFFRWAQHQIETAGRGILAYVTNNTYLAGLTHRIMRRSLLETFDQAWILNLHGEQFQADSDDENVFGIRQGVAVSFWIRGCNRQAVQYAELKGARSDKLLRLNQARCLDDLSWSALEPITPEWLCVPAPATLPPSTVHPSRSDPNRYARAPRLTDIARLYVSGVQTKADKLFIDRDRQALAKRIQHLLGGDHGTAPDWLQSRLATARFDDGALLPIQVAPMDRRWIYYDPNLLGRARWSVMRHLLHGGRGLVFMRQSTNAGAYDHFLATNCLVTDRIFRSRHGAPYVAPWRLDVAAMGAIDAIDASDVTEERDCGLAAWNLTPRAEELWQYCRGDVPSAESVWHYIYAVTHATAYRRNHANELARDFPRIPSAHSLDQYNTLAAWGAQLANVHTGTPDDYEPKQDADVPWRIGGVDVLRRWRQQRQPLTAAQQQHWLRLAAMAEHSDSIVAEIDHVIDDRWLQTQPRS